MVGESRETMFFIYKVFVCIDLHPFILDSRISKHCTCIRLHIEFSEGSHLVSLTVSLKESILTLTESVMLKVRWRNKLNNVTYLALTLKIK